MLCFVCQEITGDDLVEHFETQAYPAEIELCTSSELKGKIVTCVLIDIGRYCADPELSERAHPSCREMIKKVAAVFICHHVSLGIKEWVVEFGKGADPAGRALKGIIGYDIVTWRHRETAFDLRPIVQEITSLHSELRATVDTCVS